MRTLRAIFLVALLCGAQAAFGQVPPIYVPPPPPAPAPAPAAPALPAVPAPSPVPPSPPAAPAPGQPAPAPLAPIDQVQIKVWISETNEQGLRDIGANLQYTRSVLGHLEPGTLQQVTTNVFDPNNPTYNVQLPAPNPAVFPMIPGTGANTLRPDADKNVANGIQSQGGAGLVTSLISPKNGTIEGVFRGIEEKSDGDLISKPELLVINNGIAEIHAGSQVPYQNIVYNYLGTGQLTVTWQDIGVNLKLQPLIQPNDNVQITITQLAVSDVVSIDSIRGIDLPVFATRQQSGMVLVPSSETLVIGGLSSRVVQKTERRIPILGSLPLLGMAFRGRNTTATNSHLLIFVSPTIVNLRKLTEDSKNALSFWQDRRWENQERIGKEIKIMQEEP